MAISFQSYNEILGKLVNHIIANSSVNDLNPGSVLLTLLEAIASNDFDNNMSVLSSLETLTLDALKNNDLDKRGLDYGLFRITAQIATGFIDIGDSSIAKQATTLYNLRLAPIPGNTRIYVINAKGWTETGFLYVGRGTQRFEGPLEYESIIDRGSFYEINLKDAISKEHLISDTVINAQGTPDRYIAAGTTVVIPSNNQRPEIQYRTTQDAILASGEDLTTRIPIVSVVSGSINNAGIGTIVRFNKDPFPGATARNPEALIDGQDTESDDNFRERIKNHSNTLARGTRDSILSSIIGLSNPADGKQVTSAQLIEPPKIGDPSLVYIDDGSGFQPSFLGQSVDVLINSAIGEEEFLQLSRFPVTRPQIINLEEGPVVMTDNMRLSVIVDDVEESVVFRSRMFLNVSSATYPEIIAAINDQAQTFRARLTDGSKYILLYPIEHNIEQIQVMPTPLNDILKFPTTSYSYISLYRNNQILRERSASATIYTKAFNLWKIEDEGTIILSVDGTPTQTASFGPLDFGNVPVDSALLDDWVLAFNRKVAGITASRTSADTVQIQSNKLGKESKIDIIGGTYMSNMFDLANLSVEGKSADFKLNRQTGNIQLLFKPNVGDSITAGSEDTKGDVLSKRIETGNIVLTIDETQRSSQIFLSVDDINAAIRPLPIAIGTEFKVTKDSLRDDIMILEVTNSPSLFINVQIGDLVFIAYRGDPSSGSNWFAINNCGIFKIRSKTQTKLYLYNVDSVTDAEVRKILDINDIKVFSSKTYVQKYESNADTTIQGLNSSFNESLLNIASQIFKTNQIKLTSTTEDGGAIALPVSVGRFPDVFVQTIEAKEGNQSHIANRKTDKDVIGSVAFTDEINQGWLGRHSYGNKHSTLIESSEPNSNEVFGEALKFSEDDRNNIEVESILSHRDGANIGLYSTVKELISTDEIRTQKNKPNTLLDFSENNTIDIYNPLALSSDDNIVLLVDGDINNKLINVNMWRTGIVNEEYFASDTEFSADDFDNEPGINFSDTSVWGKESLNTEFKDYALYFRARNWYRTGGANADPAASGTMIIRAKEFGPNGEKQKFKITFPSLPDQPPKIRYDNKQNSETITILEMGSQERIVTNVLNGSKFTVSQIGTTDFFKYQFYNAIDDVEAGIVVSISSNTDTDPHNTGVFSVRDVNVDERWIEVYNPSGVSTDPGVAQVIEVTALSDIVGKPDVYDLTIIQDALKFTTGDYFIVNDSTQNVVFWYAVDEPTAIPPTVPGVTNYQRIDIQPTFNQVQIALSTAGVLNGNIHFDVELYVANIRITRKVVGPMGDITVVTTTPSILLEATAIPGTPGQSLDGKYFQIYDKNGSVAIILKSFITTGLDRSMVVDEIEDGDLASVVALKIANRINEDPEFTATSNADSVTITNIFNGDHGESSDFDSGFTIADTTPGKDVEYSLTKSPDGIQFFKLDKNTVKDICETISSSSTLIAAPVGDDGLEILLSTYEEVYSYDVPEDGLSYGHNPDTDTPATKNTISLFDSTFYVKEFKNQIYGVPAANFTLKSSMIINMSAPHIYNLSNCPNSDTYLLGEIFKLSPSNIYNVYHHLTHRALSQLPILTDISIVDNYRKLQIKSKELGSKGSIEIVGGRANIGTFAVIRESASISNTVQIPISAFPSTLISGSSVKIVNSKVAKRKDVYSNGDSFQVKNTDNTGYYRILTNPKSIGTLADAEWTITDVSVSEYDLDRLGTVWRIENTAIEGVPNIDFTKIKEGDKLFIYGQPQFNSENNYVFEDDAEKGIFELPGFTILKANNNDKYIDFINIKGKELSDPESIDPLKQFEVYPCPIIEWKVDHDTTTKYKIQSLGFNNLFALTHVDGKAPWFKDCGVCVDDFMVISGPTFKNNNRGRFRVICVTNEYIVYENPIGINEEHTVVNFNDIFDNDGGLQAQWQTNSTQVTGVPGTFSAVLPNDWVKKYTDSDELYVQVNSIESPVPGSIPPIDRLNLKSQYFGSNEQAIGVKFNQSEPYLGVPLLSAKDIRFYEGDSLVLEDNLVIANNTSNGWFNTANSGTFNVSEYGINLTEADYRPYIQIFNAGGVIQTSAEYSAVVEGYYFLESEKHKYESYRQIQHVAINQNNTNERFVYVYPNDRGYKISKNNGSNIVSTDKIGFGLNPVVGVDGYQFYVGLLGDVQKTIDGYDPDLLNFPGRRAVGTSVEVLPPLIKNISMSIRIVTKNGFNLADIGNDIKSSIIAYVNNLGVGGDVILSAIISRVMEIDGVASVTFAEPTPNTERISIEFDQKAYTSSDAIKIS